ncbi:MAG: hypothetical protein AB1714_07895 [Acidobacteriota bacterium]
MLRKILLIGFSIALLPRLASSWWNTGYSVDVLIDGRPAPEYQHGGRCYIEALQGKEYSVRLHNPTPERVAVALSVDGLNSIDAKRTSAREAAKWVLGPHETLTIDGWQTSSATARRFYFTTESDSYARWIGDTRNIGIITAAFFRERRIVVPMLERDRRDYAGRGEAAQEPQAGKCAPSPVPSDEMAATGIGRETDHRVTRVHMDLEDSPASTVNIRYEFRDELVRLGIIPRHVHPDPIERREDATGFDGMRFAPDPYRRQW